MTETMTNETADYMPSSNREWLDDARRELIVKNGCAQLSILREKCESLEIELHKHKARLSTAEVTETLMAAEQPLQDIFVQLFMLGDALRLFVTDRSKEARDKKSRDVACDLCNALESALHAAAADLKSGIPF